MLLFYAGDGKTYYIHKLKKKEKLSVFHTITIDESFSIEQVIYDLRQLYDLYDKQVKDIGIFFNFTVFKTKVRLISVMCHSHQYIE